MRSIALVVLASLSATPAAADTEKSVSLGLDAAVELGVFFVTSGKSGLTAGYRLWDRLDLSASIRGVAGPDVVGHQEHLQAGVAIGAADRIGLVLGWRVGFAQLHVSLGDDRFWVHAVSNAPIVRVDLTLSERLELQVAPLVLVGYWNRTWAFALGPEVGLRYRL